MVREYKTKRMSNFYLLIFHKHELVLIKINVQELKLKETQSFVQGP